MRRVALLLLLSALGAFVALFLVWVINPSGDTLVPSGLLPANVPRADETLGALSQIPVSPRRVTSNADPAELQSPTRADEATAPDAAPSLVRATAAVRDGTDVPSEGASREPPAEGRSHHDPDDNSERPLAWCLYTTLHDDYVSDSSTVWSGSRSVVIGKEASNGDVALPSLRVNALWQGVNAAPYRGSHIEVSAHVKTSGGAVLVLITATKLELSPGSRKIRSLPSTHTFLLPGSATNWTKLSVVGDIPDDADLLYYVLSNNGATRLWVDDVRVTPVGPELPSTVGASNVGAITLVPLDPGSMLAAPTNLDFELTNRSPGDHEKNVPENACGSVRIG